MISRNFRSFVEKIPFNNNKVMTKGIKKSRYPHRKTSSQDHTWQKRINQTILIVKFNEIACIHRKTCLITYNF